MENVENFVLLINPGLFGKQGARRRVRKIRPLKEEEQLCNNNRGLRWRNGNIGLIPSFVVVAQQYFVIPGPDFEAELIRNGGSRIPPYIERELLIYG